MTVKLNIIALLLFFFTAINAQHNHGGQDHSSSSEHNHKQEPPHGGELKDVGKYHLEIVFQALAATENFSLYVLKSNFKTLEPKGVTGTVNVKYKDGSEQTYTFTNDAVDRLFCHIKEAAKGFNATIKITYKSKEYLCFYQYKGL